jgi:hypothetical protein
MRASYFLSGDDLGHVGPGWQGKPFFFKKKNQKTSVNWGRWLAHGPGK